ncbi:MAG: 5-dehydro-4-deoxy-D-glucuronate isomerase [Actinomycetes bacterium]
MENRYATAPEHVAVMGTAELRRRFLVDDLFVAGELKLVYSHVDRVILGGVVPEAAPLPLTAPAELRAEHFLDRRELGIVNVGPDAVVTVDGTEHPVRNKGCLYVGRGTREVSFAAPGRFFLYSAPAHSEFPTQGVNPGESDIRELGDQATSNRRTLNRYIHPDGIRSCQVSMGVTVLHEGSMWNTMPAHTHDRRMEAYLYFDVADDARVVHLMGHPEETRHLVVANEQAVISPSWSIHSGVGTRAYAFVWAMAGENQDFDDMDHKAITELR